MPILLKKQRGRSRVGSIGRLSPHSHLTSVPSSSPTSLASFFLESPAGLAVGSEDLREAPRYWLVGKVAEEFGDPGNQVDLRRGTVLLPIPDAGRRRAQCLGNLALRKVQVQPSPP